MIVYCATCAGIAGLCLAQSWLLLEERYPAKYKSGLSRKPYATIAHHAFGPFMRLKNPLYLYFLLKRFYVLQRHRLDADERDPYRCDGRLSPSHLRFPPLTDANF